MGVPPVLTEPYTDSSSGFSVAAEHIDDLVLDKLLDVFPRGAEVLSRVKLCRVLGKILADRAGHGQTQVRVNIDLAHGQARCLTQLILRHTDRTGHGTAELVDHLYVFLRHGRRAVQHDRETGQPLGDFLKNIETELRLRAGLELVSAVARARLLYTSDAADD